MRLLVTALVVAAAAARLDAQTVAAQPLPPRPYVLFGPGLFRVEQEGVLYDQPVSGAQSRFGISAGGGVAFPVGPLAAFAEARVHNVFADGGSARLYPIVVGVQF
jgi:hypothetical protein